MILQPCCPIICLPNSERTFCFNFHPFHRISYPLIILPSKQKLSQNGYGVPHDWVLICRESLVAELYVFFANDGNCIEGAYVFLGYNSQTTAMKLAENSSRISEIECRLCKYTFLSRQNLPGYPDALVFRFLTATHTFPDRALHPNFYHWYILMRQFSPSTIGSWLATRLYLDPQDSLLPKFAPDTPFPPSPSQPPHPTRNNLVPFDFDQKNTKGLDDGEAAYVIEIELACGACQEAEASALRAGLEAGCVAGRVEVAVGRELLVKVRCCERTYKCDDMAEFITKLVEFRNMQIKRERKIKNPNP